MVTCHRIIIHHRCYCNSESSDNNNLYCHRNDRRLYQQRNRHRYRGTTHSQCFTEYEYLFGSICHFNRIRRNQLHVVAGNRAFFHYRSHGYCESDINDNLYCYRDKRFLFGNCHCNRDRNPGQCKRFSEYQHLQRSLHDLNGKWGNQLFVVTGNRVIGFNRGECQCKPGNNDNVYCYRNFRGVHIYS